MTIRSNGLILASIGLAIGVLVGQVSIILAFDPYRFTVDSAGLAGDAYRLGCVEAHGIRCLEQGTDYAHSLLKNFYSR